MTAHRLSARLSAVLSDPLGGTPVTPQDYVNALGANLVALWHQGYGVSESGGVVSGWADVTRDVTLTPAVVNGSGDVLYQPDGAYFFGKPVVYFALTSKILRNTTISPTLLAPGARPYSFIVYRAAALDSSFPEIWICGASKTWRMYLNGAYTHVCYFNSSSGPAFAQSGVISATTQYFVEQWSDGANMLGRVNGAALPVGGASTGTTTESFTTASIGGNGSVGAFTSLHGSVAMVGHCAALPSADELADLAALVARDFGP